MNFIRNIIDRIKMLFGIAPKGAMVNQEDKAATEANFNNTDDYLNITAIVAKKIANITLSDAIIQVTGDSARAEYLDGLIQKLVKGVNGLGRATTQMLGTGGVVLKPYVYKGKIQVEVLPQTRFVIIETVGETIIRAAFDAETIINDYDVYIRTEYHSLAEDGTYTIEQKATLNDREVPLSRVAKWANIQPKQVIQGVERTLFVYLKCPAEPRKPQPTPYGVPLTNGCDKLIKAVLAALEEVRLEIKNTRAFLGVSDMMLSDRNEILPKDGIYKKLRTDSNENEFFQIFSPDIRIQAYIDTINYYMILIEKAIGANRGMLVDLETREATATAIKRSLFDTFALVDDVRNTIEEGITHLAYAYDVIANLNRLAPMGAYNVSFNWSYGLLEDSAETFEQLLQGQAAGAINPWELRQFITDEDEDEARKNLPEMTSLLNE